MSTGISTMIGRGVSPLLLISGSSARWVAYTSWSTLRARWLSAVPCNERQPSARPCSSSSVQRDRSRPVHPARPGVPHHLEDHAVALGGACPKDDAAVGRDKVHGPEHRVLAPDALDHLVVDELLAVHEVGAVLEREQPLVVGPTCPIAESHPPRNVRRLCSPSTQPRAILAPLPYHGQGADADHGRQHGLADVAAARRRRRRRRRRHFFQSRRRKCPAHSVRTSVRTLPLNKKA